MGEGGVCMHWRCSAVPGVGSRGGSGHLRSSPPVPPAPRMWCTEDDNVKRRWEGAQESPQQAPKAKGAGGWPAAAGCFLLSIEYRSSGIERQPVHAFWSANLTTRRLLGPTWRPLKALMAVAACRERRVWRTEAGVQSEGPAGLRAQLQARQQAWHSMQPARQRQRQRQQQRRRLGRTCWRVA